MEVETPFARYRGEVEPEWVDYNGHMNVAYYLLAFDRATDLFLDHVGLDTAAREASGGTTFAAEVHLCYLRELLGGDPIRVSTRLLAHDSKRLRFIHQMYHGAEGYLAATAETLSLFVNLEARRVTAMPAFIAERVAAVMRAHSSLEPPQVAGRGIVIPEIAGN